MDKKNVRVFLEKKDRAVYISHLDLLRTMQRALKRSGLPAWYSEGFNPRIYLNFPLPLALGVTGEKEPMDFAITEEVSFEDIVKRLDSACPEGINVLSAAFPVHLNKEIGFAEYSLCFFGNGKELYSALEGFMAQENITALKQTKKKGTVEVDIKPHILLKGANPCEKGLEVQLRLPAGNELNLNSVIFSDAFEKYCLSHQTACELSCAKRTNILCCDGSDFV